MNAELQEADATASTTRWVRTTMFGNSVAGVAAAPAVGGGYRADLSWVTGPDDEHAQAKLNYLYTLSGQGSRRWYG